MYILQNIDGSELRQFPPSRAYECQETHAHAHISLFKFYDNLWESPGFKPWDESKIVDQTCLAVTRNNKRCSYIIVALDKNKSFVETLIFSELKTFSFLR